MDTQSTSSTLPKPTKIYLRGSHLLSFASFGIWSEVKGTQGGSNSLTIIPREAPMILEEYSIV